MFIQIWNKYLPVIRILLKRSTKTDQVLDMNQSDFQRAAGGKKLKFTFTFLLNNGRFKGEEAPPPLAHDLIEVLQADNTTNDFLHEKQFQFSMNNNFQLVIKNLTPVDDGRLEADEAAQR